MFLILSANSNFNFLTELNWSGLCDFSPASAGFIFIAEKPRVPAAKEH